MPKGQLKRAKRLKKGPKNPFLNLKNKKSVFRRVVKRLNTEKSKKITERGKGKNHGRLRLFAQPHKSGRALSLRLKPEVSDVEYRLYRNKYRGCAKRSITSWG